MKEWCTTRRIIKRVIEMCGNLGDMREEVKKYGDEEVPQQ